jgi:hypothetical protein
VERLRPAGVFQLANSLRASRELAFQILGSAGAVADFRAESRAPPRVEIS